MVQMANRPHDTSSRTIGNLRLNIKSYGVSNRLGARRVRPDEDLRGVEMRLDESLLAHSGHAVGWRISDSCFKNDLSEYAIWSPTGREDCQVYLPPWTRPGDWVIKVRGYAFGWFGMRDRPVMLVMREGGDVSRGPLIGRGFGTMDEEALAPTKFQIHWDAEDLVILCMAIIDSSAMGRAPDDWLGDFLNAGICTQKTPGSSYAIRRDDI